MSGTELTSVAYKKGNWLRYTLWALAAICIGVLLYSFISTMCEVASQNAADTSSYQPEETGL